MFIAFIRYGKVKEFVGLFSTEGDAYTAFRKRYSDAIIRFDELQTRLGGVLILEHVDFIEVLDGSIVK